MNHIRVITRRPDRRIMGAPGASHTLCGAAVTDRDLLMSDARRTKKAGELDKWLSCPACRDKLTPED